MSAIVFWRPRLFAEFASIASSLTYGSEITQQWPHKHDRPTFGTGCCPVHGETEFHSISESQFEAVRTSRWLNLDWTISV